MSTIKQLLGAAALAASLAMGSAQAEALREALVEGPEDVGVGRLGRGGGREPVGGTGDGGVVVLARAEGFEAAGEERGRDGGVGGAPGTGGSRALLQRAGHERVVAPGGGAAGVAATRGQRGVGLRVPRSPAPPAAPRAGGGLDPRTGPGTNKKALPGWEGFRVSGTPGRTRTSDL